MNNDWFSILRKKWNEIPGDRSNRLESNQLLALDDDALSQLWRETHKKDTTGDRFNVRGWYHLLYKDLFKGKKIIDVGSGFGIDALTFAMAGADVTCMDIVEDNLSVLRRIAELLDLKGQIKFLYMKDVSSIDNLDYDYDAIWCQGSLINAPFDLIRLEVQELIKHLKPNGRFIKLAYPKERWTREGCMPFTEWGEKTDGKGTPYMEWYDIEKVKQLFTPTNVDVVLSFNFHNDDFNWFDLVVRKQ